MKYEGIITNILPLEQVGQNQINKQTIVLEELTDKERKGWIAIDFLKDKTDLIEGLNVWDVVTASINFRVNEYNWRRYNWVTCWKLEAKQTPTVKQHDTGGDYTDELPF